MIDITRLILERTSALWARISAFCARFSVSSKCCCLRSSERPPALI
nr:MAG TPA: hypothetical protein [Caudoviricetes sp.]